MVFCFFLEKKDAQKTQTANVTSFFCLSLFFVAHSYFIFNSCIEFSKTFFALLNYRGSQICSFLVVLFAASLRVCTVYVCLQNFVHVANILCIKVRNCL